MVLQETIRGFYDAIISRDPTLICANYIADEGTYVILEGPRFSTKGIALITKGWEDFANSVIQLEKIVWTEGPFEEIHGKMGWISGIVELYIIIDGKQFMNTFRTSFVLVNDANRWKIRHEHVSIPHPDPYGVGDWLKKG